MYDATDIAKEETQLVYSTLCGSLYLLEASGEGIEEETV